MQRVTHVKPKAQRMEIIHVSAECYPVAKAGGLGDVAGALPKYQAKAGHFAKLVMPMYKTKFLYANEWVVDFKGQTNMGNWFFEYTVIKESTNKLGFDLFLVDIQGLTDREKIYGYDDDVERFTAFQIAVVHWLSNWEHKPDVVHCHDHHTALIPFMLQHCYQYRAMSDIPTVLTIHNAQYQGWMGWDKNYYMKVTTVSSSYLAELRTSANGLEALFEYEQGKCVGIINGIDNEVWDPKTDEFLYAKYTSRNVTAGKLKNKNAVCKQFGINPDKPLAVFIGRLVGEKAADILPDAIAASIYATDGSICFVVLGSGDPTVEDRLNELKSHFPDNYNCYIGYDEGLSHKLYAAADFLLMPSRVEPCGLNQLYALRYGTVPIVRSTGGLIDTVVDMGEEQGFGIRFNHASVADIIYSVQRAVSVHHDKKHLLGMRQHMMKIDHSWEGVVEQYIGLYEGLR
ncbi:MAG: glycogen synthase, ADP-glucose transglucosylase [Chitinophagaceae bacterium]|nr:glycogen synthase, ADP-glucose transglucosylase [Chitinophagaceae bacterium]